MDLKPTEKVICACAARAWILRPDYLYDSAKSGNFQNEKKYAWDGYPARWRELALQPFAGFSILVHGQPHLATLIHAGGGQTVQWQLGTAFSFFSRDAAVLRVDFAVVGKNEELPEDLVRALGKRGIPCVSSQYLVEWLISDRCIDMEKYVVISDGAKKKRKHEHSED